eukprot:56508-Eustigmatos_ZCMA.PRE.2
MASPFAPRAARSAIPESDCPFRSSPGEWVVHAVTRSVIDAGPTRHVPGYYMVERTSVRTQRQDL